MLDDERMGKTDGRHVVRVNGLHNRIIAFLLLDCACPVLSKNCYIFVAIKNKIRKPFSTWVKVWYQFFFPIKIITHFK